MSDIAKTHSPTENIRIFGNKQVELGKILNLKLFRDQSGFNSLWPEMRLILGETGVQLFFIKKMLANTTSNYYITL